jgi:hypothetical protein
MDVTRLIGPAIGPGVRALHGFVSRRELKRDFAQIFGTYITFHKAVDNESNGVTVNVLYISPSFWASRVKFVPGF